jgi:hypothetical protein
VSRLEAVESQVLALSETSALSESVAADKQAYGQLLAQTEDEEQVNASAVKAKLPQQLHASKFTGFDAHAPSH